MRENKKIQDLFSIWGNFTIYEFFEILKIPLFDKIGTSSLVYRLNQRTDQSN